MSANTTQIQYRGLNFLLCQAPSDRSMPDFMKTMKEHNVTKIVRCCEQTYSDKPLKEAGVTVIDFDYPDGDVPPICLLDSLRSLLLPSSTSVSSEEAICIHCQSGLGRGPLLAALALVEKGMPAQGAIDLLRRPPRKKGSIQLTDISTYRILSNLSSCFSIF